VGVNRLEKVAEMQTTKNEGLGFWKKVSRSLKKGEGKPQAGHGGERNTYKIN